jgi:hypothetical protein
MSAGGKGTFTTLATLGNTTPEVGLAFGLLGVCFPMNPLRLERTKLKSFFYRKKVFLIVSVRKR